MEYLRPCQASDKRFVGRDITVSGDGFDSVIPVPDGLVLCDACNQEIEAGFLLYLGDEELAADQPYGAFCSACCRDYYSEAVRL